MVLEDLIRRGANIEYNPYGFDHMDLSFPRIVKARSLLEHTEKLSHEHTVQTCWAIFDKCIANTGYSIKVAAPHGQHEFKKPLKVTFQAPTDHSTMDRLRIVDLHSDVPISQQVSKMVPVPPGMNINTTQALLYNLTYRALGLPNIGCRNFGSTIVVSHIL
jgi:hypothetical protein